LSDLLVKSLGHKVLLNADTHFFSPLILLDWFFPLIKFCKVSSYYMVVSWLVIEYICLPKWIPDENW
jgi:hypothetical protein